MIRFALLLTLFSLFGMSFAADDYLWPLPSSDYITGGYADSRPDHFHGGLDLRAQSPQIVLAPLDGFIERFAVNPPGYGHVIYYRMSDGRTAVFAHLSKFNSILEKALRDSQLVEECYTVDFSFDPAPPEFHFHRGDTLAFTGETGRGPAHLHFEVREEAVQTDPLSYYMRSDDQFPRIVELRWISLDDFTPMSAGTIVSANSEIASDSPIAFMIKCYDPGPWGRNAVPAAIRVLAGDVLQFSCFPSRIDLAGAQSIYGQLVWPEILHHDSDLRRLFRIPPAHSYREDSWDSYGWLADLDHKTVTIEVEDRVGNISRQSVRVSCADFRNSPGMKIPQSLSAGFFELNGDPVSLSWANLEVSGSESVIIGPSELAFASKATLSFKHSNGFGGDGSFLYSQSSAGSRRALWKIPGVTTDKLSACYVLKSGTYGIAKDSTPPELLISVRKHKLRFTLKDGESSIDDSSIRCKVNGETAIAEFEYDDNGGAIWTQHPLRPGSNDVEFRAANRAGLEKTWALSVTNPQ